MELTHPFEADFTIEHLKRKINSLEFNFLELENLNKNIISNFPTTPIGVNMPIKVKIIKSFQKSIFVYDYCSSSHKHYSYAQFQHFRFEKGKNYQITNLGFSGGKYGSCDFKVVELVESKELIEKPQTPILPTDIQEVVEVHITKHFTDYHTELNKQMISHFNNWLNNKENMEEVAEWAETLSQKLWDIKDKHEGNNQPLKPLVLEVNKPYRFEFIRIKELPQSNPSIVVKLEGIDDTLFKIPCTGHSSLYYKAQNWEKNMQYRVINLGKKYENKRDRIGKFHFEIMQITY